MGNLATVINRATINSSITDTYGDYLHLKIIAEDLKERNKKFLEIAQSWVRTDLSSNPSGQHINGSWRKDYHDNDSTRGILKVNSHQLDETGSHISTKRRYPSLIPNLSLLSANHLADKIADIPTHNTPQTINEQDVSIYNPPSPLRFFFTIDGKTVDKHISDILPIRFTMEKVKRLKTKKTQGLLWRLYDHVTMSWKDMQFHKGVHRSLLGLSRTHTRSLYKSTTYREGILREYLDTLECEVRTKEIRNLNQRKLIDTLSGCKWCNQNSSTATEKGNRMHALLSCNHVDIQGYRNNLRTSIQSEIQNLMEIIITYTSEKGAIKFLKNIEETFISLQENQCGRLRRIPRANNKSYATMKDLLRKYDEQDILKCIQNNIGTFSLEVFGIIPQNTNAYRDDANIGVVDGPWLGLIPIKLDEAVHNHIKIIQHAVNHLASKQEITDTIKDKWGLIKGLILGLAAGVHKIIGNTSHEIEKGLKRKYELDLFTIAANMKKTRKSIQPKKTNTIQTPLCLNCTPQSSRTTTQATQLHKCSGITCNNNRPNWKIFQAFHPNQISIKKKHCLRCTRQSSAIRSASTILHHMLSHPNSKHDQKLLTILRKASITRPTYIQLMSMLQPHFTTEAQKCKAKYKSTSSRILDTHKSICRVIIQAFQPYQHPTSYTHQQILEGMQKHLANILSNSKKKLETRKRKSVSLEMKINEI